MLIVGLGNPGATYENTRHNAGFMVLDKLAEKYDIAFNKNKFNALICDTYINDKRVLVIKPQTFMNNSGEAVSAVMKFYKIPTDKLIVISDDISLPPGKMRIRAKGSAGGQNGLKNIISHIATDEFVRIKLGIGDRPDRSSDLANWVLGKMNEDDFGLFKGAVDNAVRAIETILKSNVETAMNRYNK
ncbi:MAG: aminoacyl-tRNA hydrolase [Ruminococcaceae bacterium]|nr:aminoacyl-tRNA hydrolase [Oscillospiraceae bacterium]